MLLDLSPLRVSRDYRLLFFGQLVSFFGSMMTFIVVPWQMYQLTQSSAMVGYISVAEFVPTIPNYLRGRLASIEMMSYLTGPMLGSAKMGIVAETFSVKTALVSGGVLCVVSVFGAAVFLPRFLAYDGREGVKQKEREEAERSELLRVSQGEF